MDHWLEEEVERLCTRDRIVAAARARARSALFRIVQRRHGPLTCEVKQDRDEDREGIYR
jgi:predicted GNAT superfamily acetyltransferase